MSMPISSTFDDLHESIYQSRLLIVDDAEINLLFLERILGAGGFTAIKTASGGEEALLAFHEFKPDMIILDLIMPEMDGFECCRAIRKLPDGGSLPILVQTALTDPEEKIRAFHAGATDFITKPVFPDELYARVIVHLEKQITMKRLQAYKQRVEMELNSARDLQCAILPRIADIENIKSLWGLDVASHFEPTSEVGGDFWGIKPLFPHQVAFWIVDFSGHGIAAALNVFRLHTCLQEYSPLAARPGEYLAQLNEKLLQLLPKGQFATMLYGIVDTSTNQLLYASAGCPHPILVQGKKYAPEILDGTGQPIGIGLAQYPTRSVDFLQGDSICFYSDALTETENAVGECIDENTLAAWLAESEGPAQMMVTNVIKRFRLHAPSRNRRDDLTIGLIRRCGPI